MIDPSTGQLAIELYSLTPINMAAAGSLVTVDFHLLPGATGSATVNLVDAVNPGGGRWFNTNLADPNGALILETSMGVVPVTGVEGLTATNPVVVPSAATTEGVPAAVSGGAPAETVSDPARLAPAPILAEEDVPGTGALLLAGPGSSLVIGVGAAPQGSALPFFPPAIGAIPRLVEQVLLEQVHKLTTPAVPNGLENLLWDAADLKADWVSGLGTAFPRGGDYSPGTPVPPTANDGSASEEAARDEFFAQVGAELE